MRAAVLGGLRWYLRARRVLPDPPLRPVAESFGAAYGACPHLPDVGYQPPSGSRAPSACGAETVAEQP